MFSFVVVEIMADCGPSSAAIGSLAVVLFVPAGVLLARLGRSNSWFPLHRAIQALSVVLLITAAVMGIVETAPGPHFSDTHQRLAHLIPFLS